MVRVTRNKFSLLCQVLALSAIMVPILIIFGLKYGIVTALKERLLNNPATMEVWPTEGVEITESLIAQIQEWPECGFVVPCIGAAYSSVGVAKGDAPVRMEDRYDLVPSGAGDPLMLKTGQPVPGDGQVVLTAALAEELQLQPGDTVRIVAWRNAGQEKLELPHVVAGVIPVEYSHNRKQLFVPLQATLQVEQFIVEGKGKLGESAKLGGPCYSGLVTGSRDAARVAAFARLANMLEHTTAHEAGIPEPVPGDTRVLYSAAHRISPQTVDVLMEHASHLGLSAYPWVEPVELPMPAAAGGGTVRVLGVLPMQGSAGRVEAPPVLVVSPARAAAGTATLVLEGPQGQSSVKCLLKGDTDIPEAAAYATPQFAGLLRRAARVRLVWDFESGTLYHPVLSFCHIRLYAGSLEDTEKLMSRLQAAGVPCNARVGAIRQVLALEQSLNRLFFIICLGAGIGAVVSYGMSLFNAAELHRRDYALIQLLGAGKCAVCIMPVIDALATTLAAASLSLLVFYGVASVIGYMFVTTAGQGALCRMEPFHMGCFVSACLAISLVAALSAAAKVLSISPSEIIRES